MSEPLRYVVRENDAGVRLDALMAQCALCKSRSAAAKSIEAGDVLVNGQATQKKYVVLEGDVITYAAEERKDHSLKPSPIELDIRYEDDDIIILSKQAGLVCHPSIDHEQDTLVNALIYRYGVENLCNLQGSDGMRPGIVHRLDRDTSGLMLAAKTDRAGAALMDRIRDRAVDRHYIALAHGIVSADSGMIDAPLARHAVDRKRMSVSDASASREAITTFKVLERFAAEKDDSGYTLMDCKLFTGRTHQIRVHMEYIKHPVVGDPVYSAHGPKAASAQCGVARQFLHSYRLEFSHPITAAPMALRERCPRDLEHALDALSSRSMGRTAYGDEIWESLKTAPQPSISPCALRSD